MSYIVSNIVYPSDKQNAVVETYMEIQKKYPHPEDLMEETIPLAVSQSHDGMRVMVINKVKPGKLEEALANVGKRSFAFNHIPGYESTIEVWKTLEEAFAIAGIPMPG